MYQENVTPKKKKKWGHTLAYVASPVAVTSSPQLPVTADAVFVPRVGGTATRAAPSHRGPSSGSGAAAGHRARRGCGGAGSDAAPPAARPDMAGGSERTEAGAGRAQARRGAAGAAQSPAPLGGGGRKAEGGSAMPGPAAPGPGPDPEESYDFLFKLVLIGDASVGKTCLVQRFKTGAFAERQGSTIGVDFTMKSLEIQGKRVKVSGGAEGRPPPRAAARQGELRSARRGPRLPRGCPARCRLPHPAAYLSIPAVLLCSEEGLRGSGASFPNGPGEGAEPSLHINLLATVGPAV